MKTQDAENIRRLFWTVYMFDKNITLLLGRTPHIQVHDSGAKFPTVAIDPSLRPWDETFILGAKLAIIQGQIYSNFYSPAGVQRPSAYRSADINRLSEAMEKWKLEFDEIKPYGMKNAQVFELSRGNWDITYYSILTSLYSVSPDPKVGADISHQCFAAARRSLESHLQYLPKYQESCLLSDNEYFNFVLFFASFTPFIVTFLYVIITNSHTEIGLLEEVTSTLKNVPQASESVKKLFKVCSTCVQLAKGLVQPDGSPMEFHDLENGIFRCTHGPEHSLWNRDLIQEAVQGNYTSEADARSVFDFLDDWINRQPLPMDFFDMNLDMEFEEEAFP